MKTWLTIFVLVVVAGCASSGAIHQSRRLMEQGKTEDGVRVLERAVKADPDNAELRRYYMTARNMYVNQQLYEGKKLRLLGRWQEALDILQRAQRMDPSNTRAKTAIEEVQKEQRLSAIVADAKVDFEAGRDQQAKKKIEAVLSENPAQENAKALLRRIEEKTLDVDLEGPKLKPEFRKPVTLEFRDAPLKSVFEVLARASGINFVFDRDVNQDIKVSLFLRETSIADAVHFMLVTNQLAMKVLNENTVLVYPNLPNKARDYQELVVKSFYLGNADVKQTLNLIKTVVKTRDVFVDERLNLLVMRDTPQAVRLAEKLIAAQDLAQPEVILEVEVLEVARTKLLQLGMRYPTQVSVGIEGKDDGPGRISLPEWIGENRSQIVRINTSDPAFILNLQRQDGETNILANPRIRVKNREKAKIHIGDRLPVITTTSTANVGVSESVQYLDVGLKLDVEPTVYLDDEVEMKVSLDVSNIVQEIRSQNGTLTYRIGTRNTATVLRVANGETQVLAGLIQDEDRKTADKVPGLADLPVLGRLFSSNNDNRTKTEIVLLITPYVVRNIDRPPPSELEVQSGTESSLGAAPIGLPSAAPAGAAPQGATGIRSPVRPVPGQEAATRAVSPAGGQALAQTILLSAPLRVQPGEEFTVSISVPSDLRQEVQAELNYDASKIRPVGGAGSSGLLPLTLRGSTSIQFRAMEGQGGVAQISLGNVSAAATPSGEPLQFVAPVPVSVQIAQ